MIVWIFLNGFSGLALMTPLGKVVLNLADYSWNDLRFMFFMNIFVAFILFYTGIIFVVRGSEIVKE